MQSALHMYDPACCAMVFLESASSACMVHAIFMRTPGMLLLHVTILAPSSTAFRLSPMRYAASAWPQD